MYQKPVNQPDLLVFILRVKGLLNEKIGQIYFGGILYIREGVGEVGQEMV